MPARPSINWSVVRDLLLQGLTTREISQKLDIHPITIRQKIRKEGWDIQKNLTHTLANPTQLPLDHYSNISKRLLSEQIIQLLKSANKLSKTGGVVAVKQHADICKTIADTASKTFGWSLEHRSQPAINIAVLTGHKPSQVDCPNHPELASTLDNQVGNSTSTTSTTSTDKESLIQEPLPATTPPPPPSNP